MAAAAAQVPSRTDRLYTAEELLAMPADAHFELIEGRLEPMSPTGGDHGFATHDLSLEIGWFVRQHSLGRCTAAETGFLLARNPDVVLAPDFAYISREKLDGTPASRSGGYLAVVPDLVVETRSPSDRPTAVAEKARRWLSYGTAVVIDADPERRELTLYRTGDSQVTLRIDDTLTIPDVLAGFSLPLSRIF